MSPFRALNAREVPGEVVDAVEAGTISALIGDSSRILEANDTYLELTGFSRDELDAGELSWLRLTPPEYLAADARGIGEARANGVSEPYEKAYVRRDGTRVEIRMVLLLLELDPLRIFAVVAPLDDEAGGVIVDALRAAF